MAEYVQKVIKPASLKASEHLLRLPVLLTAEVKGVLPKVGADS